jgi:hypothetical protein
MNGGTGGSGCKDKKEYGPAFDIQMEVGNPGECPPIAGFVPKGSLVVCVDKLFITELAMLIESRCIGSMVNPSPHAPFLVRITTDPPYDMAIPTKVPPQVFTVDVDKWEKRVVDLAHREKWSLSSSFDRASLEISSYLCSYLADFLSKVRRILNESETLWVMKEPEDNWQDESSHIKIKE